MPDQPKPSTATKVKQEVKKEIDKISPASDQNILAALSYAWLISVVMLVVKRKDEYVLFHARQGVVLFVGSFFGFIPLIGWIVAIASWIGMVVGFVMAWQGKRYELPFVHKLSQHIKL